MFLVGVACLAFFSCALPDSSLGVAWPSMRVTFGVPISAAGLVPPVGVAGALVSTALSARLVARLGVGRLLAASTALSAAGLVIAATSATFWQFVVSVAIVGLSAGALDATLNAYAARKFGALRINLLHASYGVGAAVSPLVVTVVVQTGIGWPWAYAILGALQLGLAVVFLGTEGRWHDGVVDRGETDHDRQAPRPGARVWTTDAVLSLLSVVVVTGIESSMAMWSYTFLTRAAGVDPVAAGAVASGYWMSVFVGRVALGLLAGRIGAWPVLAIGTGGLIIASGLVMIGAPGPSMVGVLIFGVATAPIYPLLILTTGERTSEEVSDRVVGYQAAASSLGAATVPPLVGLAIGASAAAFAPLIAILCAGAAVLHVAMRSRRRDRARHS